MGIPSYFSYIIKNHSNIIRTLTHHNNVEKTQFDALYMDCNSIIYDAIRQIETSEKMGTTEYEVAIIGYTIDKIKQYIQTINPTKLVYIAFDGVAPFAKMEQQRTRRYKSTFIQTIDFETGGIFSEEEVETKCKNGFSSCNITPGTHFMELLSKHIEYVFSHDDLSQKRKIIVSTSKEPGEGEHKMFAYMRENATPEQTIAVYGLDADLIMLSIVHALLCNNIYICRETPEFSFHVLQTQIGLDRNNPNELLFVNIELLSKSILKEMGISAFDTGRIYDYIFLCFFLGNDFLPHFPALNIRTNGIQQLLDVYAKHISGGGGGSGGRYFISTQTGKIQWKWVFVFLRELAKYEHDFILNEYSGRHKLRNKLGLSEATKKERETLFENTPILYRAEELYICPYEQGWESRYYSTAFDEPGEPAFIQRVCVNYLEGIEWVFKYYTEGCPHWRWKYDFNYPPLLSDLIKFIPQYEMDFFEMEKMRNKMAMIPLKPKEQLIYVLPKPYHYLIPGLNRAQIEKNAHLFPELNEFKFQWMFCRYFWECHIQLPEISISKLENIAMA